MENMHLYIQQKIGLTNVTVVFHKLFFPPTQFKTVSKTSLVFRHLSKDEQTLFNTLCNKVISQYLCL